MSGVSFQRIEIRQVAFYDPRGTVPQRCKHLASTFQIPQSLSNQGLHWPGRKAEDESGHISSPLTGHRGDALQPQWPSGRGLRFSADAVPHLQSPC